MKLNSFDDATAFNAISESVPRNVPELIRRLQKRGVPSSQYSKYINRYIEFKARMNKIPIHGSFELTPLCNLDCKMCYVHLSNDRFSKDDLLSVSCWKRLITQAHEAGMASISLTGGECLTYPGFDELFLYTKNLRLKCAILTNGYLINEERVTFFSKHPPDLIQITLYGSSDDVYERVTGHRAFSTVYKNILNLKQAEIPILIGLTPNSFMGDDIFNLIDLVEKLEVPYNINSGLITPRNNTGRAKADFSPNQYVDLLKYRSKKNNCELIPIDMSELPDENRMGTKNIGLKCGGGRSTFTIKYDGCMCPCPSFEELISKPLEVGFIQAWTEINDMAENYRCPEECAECIYKPYCAHCMAVHKNAPLAGHCDPIVCDRTKKMISAGLIEFKGI